MVLLSFYDTMSVRKNRNVKCHCLSECKHLNTSQIAQEDWANIGSCGWPNVMLSSEQRFGQRRTNVGPTFVGYYTLGQWTK